MSDSLLFDVLTSMLCFTVTKHGNTFAHKPQHWAYLNTSSLEHTPLYCQPTSRQPFVLQKPPSSHNLRKEIFHRGTIITMMCLSRAYDNGQSADIFQPNLPFG